MEENTEAVDVETGQIPSSPEGEVAASDEQSVAADPSPVVEGLADLAPEAPVALSAEEEFVRLIDSNPAVKALLEEQLRQQQVQEQLAQTRAQLESSGMDDAAVEYAVQLQKWALDLEAQQRQIERSQLGSRIEELTRLYPTLDRPVLETVAQHVPATELNAVARALHARNTTLLAQERAKYAAEKARDGGTFVSGDPATGPVGGAVQRPAVNRNASWGSLLGVVRR